MREVLATAGAVFLALTLHAQVQIPDFLRGKSGQQLRSVGIILPDTLKIWPSGPADGYVPTLKPFGQDLSEALLVIYPYGKMAWTPRCTSTLPEATGSAFRKHSPTDPSSQQNWTDGSAK